MPHCLLEYSDNVTSDVDIKSLLREINQQLAETTLFKLIDIKSRAIKHETFVIGDGDDSRAFVALNLSILSGREESIKKQLSDGLLKLLERHFSNKAATQKLSLTVQISEMDKGSYARLVVGG